MKVKIQRIAERETEDGVFISIFLLSSIIVNKTEINIFILSFDIERNNIARDEWLCLVQLLP